MHVLLALVALSAVSHAAPQPQDRDRYDDLIVAHFLQKGLGPKLVKAVIAVDSQFLPEAVSPVGARAAGLHEPSANIAAGTAYLAVLFRTALKRARLEGTRFRDAPASVTRDVVAARDPALRPARPRALPLARDGGRAHRGSAAARRGGGTRALSARIPG